MDMTFRNSLLRLLLASQLLPVLCSRLPCHESQLTQITDILPKSGTTTPGAKIAVYGVGFSPGAIVFFGGREARQTHYLSPSEVEVVTPYLRPGKYDLQIKSSGVATRSEVAFTASPSPVDSQIDRAVSVADKGDVQSALATLAAIARTNGDYQVRAFAHFQAAQIYYSIGDWWRWAGETSSVYDDSDKSGSAVQTFWKYRLALQLTEYLLPTGSTVEGELQSADWTVSYDVTANPEPRFYRSLLNARYGNLEKAKTDSDSILSEEPGNALYRALAAYISVLNGSKVALEAFSEQATMDVRALSLLGQVAYLAGDIAGARRWWKLEAQDFPKGASLAYLAGRKHLEQGQKRIAFSLLSECVAMAPGSKEANEAEDLLAATSGTGGT
jgi:tetratricopeptide (TPR) repeat protein